MPLAYVPGERARKGHANPAGRALVFLKAIGFSALALHCAFIPFSGRAAGYFVFPPRVRPGGRSK